MSTSFELCLGLAVCQSCVFLLLLSGLILSKIVSFCSFFGTFILGQVLHNFLLCVLCLFVWIFLDFFFGGGGDCSVCVLCSSCCLCLWIINTWMPFRFSHMFISVILFADVFVIFVNVILYDLLMATPQNCMWDLLFYTAVIVFWCFLERIMILWNLLMPSECWFVLDIDSVQSEFCFPVSVRFIGCLSELCF